MAHSINSLGDLLALIPHLTGHDINDAIVVVGVDSDTTLRAMWRLADAVPGVLDKISISLLDIEPSAVILIGYAPVDVAAPALAGLAEHITSSTGIDDVACLVSHDGRHWDLGDPDCPEEGHPTTVSAEAAALLKTAPGPVFADEESLALLLAPVTGDARAAMTAATTALTADLANNPLLLDRIDLAALLAATEAPAPLFTAHAAAALDRSIGTFMRALELTGKDPATS